MTLCWHTHPTGPHARSGTQLLVPDDVDVHNNKLLQLPRVTQTVEWVTPVSVSVHLSNWWEVTDVVNSAHLRQKSDPFWTSLPPAAPLCCSLGWKNLPHRRLFEQNQKHMLPSNVRLLWHFEQLFLTQRKHFGIIAIMRVFLKIRPPFSAADIKLNANWRDVLFAAYSYEPVSCWAVSGNRPAMRWLNMCRADEDQTKDSRKVSVATRANVFDLCFQISRA